MNSNIIDVDAKVIEVVDFCERPRDTWRNRCFYHVIVVPCAVVGACTVLLWTAGQLGIGNFMLYYGASTVRICGA